jgi:uncharacterized protein with HEPN domain
MPERDEGLYLSDLLGAIDKILAYTVDGQAQFLGDLKTQDAVVRNLEVIGEAVRGVSQQTREAHPEIPWRKIAGTRDRVIHGYFSVSLRVVWDIVANDLPRLRSTVAAILAKREQG